MGFKVLYVLVTSLYIKCKEPSKIYYHSPNNFKRICKTLPFCFSSEEKIDLDSQALQPGLESLCD